MNITDLLIIGIADKLNIDIENVCNKLKRNVYFPFDPKNGEIFTSEHKGFEIKWVYSEGEWSIIYAPNNHPRLP